jgi:serine/threonine-protein kinase
MQPGPLNLARLPFGTLVGPWRVLERRGLGAYGAVYRAVAAQAPHETVALKLALHADDARFVREGELLSRLHHPCVPRLVDRGLWQPSSGPAFPYLAMEWVDGVSLYDWGWDCRPTSRQVLRAFAHLARALEATHAAGGVHRDVKGDNVLVRQADGHVFLTDFGSGHFVGAAPLTWHPLPPGTPFYRSPEAWDFVRLPAQGPPVPYAPGPADDVFALGVTAYRLITGDYPLGSEPEDPAARWEALKKTGFPSARALNPRCCEELDDLTSRMLSVVPEARGTAGALAGALEQATREAGPEADVPLFVPEAVEHEAEPPHEVRRAPGHPWRSWLTAASLGGALAVGMEWLLSARPDEQAPREDASLTDEMKDGGTVAVGDSALTAPVAFTQTPSAWSGIALEMPQKPFPGQTRPDANGRCPGKVQVPINGGCWIKMAAGPKECEAEAYVYKGACYIAVFPPTRPSTSNPTEPSNAHP